MSYPKLSETHNIYRVLLLREFSAKCYISDRSVLVMAILAVRVLVDVFNPRYLPVRYVAYAPGIPGPKPT